MEGEVLIEDEVLKVEEDHSEDVMISMIATIALATSIAIGSYLLFRMLRRDSDRKVLERHNEWAKKDMQVKQRKLDMELARSVLRRDLAKVKSSLKLGADPTAYRFDGNDTLLHVAKRMGNFTILVALSKRNNQIKERNANGKTMNEISSENDFARDFLMKNSSHKVLDKDTTRFLCKDINILEIADQQTGDTILHVAAEKGNIQCVLELVNQFKNAAELKNDSSFKLSSLLNKRKETVLHRAVRNENPDVVRQILTLCKQDKYITALQDVDGNTVLHAAAKRPEIFDIVITHVPPGTPNVRNNKNISAKELNISLDPTMDVDTFE